MFRLFDVYSELKGKKIVYQDYPTPKERQDNIFSMFKDDIPEEMNTEEGNKVLNLIFHKLLFLFQAMLRGILQNMRLLIT